jgi:peptidylprolyl isomerase
VPRVIGNITIVVDGFNAPISAGNFIDLCQRGFYNKLPFRVANVSGRADGPAIPVVVGGTYKDGFIDPIKGKQRRVPLEIMRSEDDGKKCFYGQARNTGLFTRYAPK